MTVVLKTDWSAITAWAAVATVVIYVVLGVFAGWQIWEARRSREEQARLARELQEEQARPFVIVDFEPGFLIYLVVENIGRTMARNVTITTDKPFESTLPDPDIVETPLFREPIPTLPPGKKIRVLFDTAPARLASGLPRAYEVTVRYEGPFGQRYGPDRYPLDLTMYLGSALPPKGLPDLVDEIEKVRKELAKWTDGSRGLQVNTSDREKRKRAERRRWRTSRFMRSAKADGIAPAARTYARDAWRRALTRRGLR